MCSWLFDLLGAKSFEGDLIRVDTRRWQSFEPVPWHEIENTDEELAPTWQLLKPPQLGRPILGIVYQWFYAVFVQDLGNRINTQLKNIDIGEKGKRIAGNVRTCVANWFACGVSSISALRTFKISAKTIVSSANLQKFAEKQSCLFC